MKKTLLILSIFISALGLSIPAYAAATTATMNASINIAGTGTISAATLNLGSGVVPGVDSTANTTFTVNVSTDVIYNVTLSAGANASGGLRRLATSGNTTDYPNYYFYKDVAMTQEWGDSDFTNTYSSGSSYQSTGTGANQTLTIYGKGTSGAAMASGTYSDTVTMTLNY